MTTTMSIGKIENKYNTTITDINIDGINYKYYHNKKDNIHYITSTEQIQEILDYLNIFISYEINKSIFISDIQNLKRFSIYLITFNKR